MEEVERLKKESKEMIQQLKQLEQQEHELTIQNEILARETLLNGFDPTLLEPLAPKRRKQHAKKNESETASTNKPGKASSPDEAHNETQLSQQPSNDPTSTAPPEESTTGS